MNKTACSKIHFDNKHYSSHQIVFCYKSVIAIDMRTHFYTSVSRFFFFSFFPSLKIQLTEGRKILLIIQQYFTVSHFLCFQANRFIGLYWNKEALLHLWLLKSRMETIFFFREAWTNQFLWVTVNLKENQTKQPKKPNQKNKTKKKSTKNQPTKKPHRNKT